MDESRTGARLSDRQRIAWLRLLRSENIGPRSFRELVNRFGGASAALEGLPELARRGGRRNGVRVFTQEAAEDELEAVSRAGAVLAAPGEDGYPPALAHIHDAPPLVCVKGRPELSIGRIVAVVGARQASALGQRMAALIARELGSRGYVITSGLARGVDTSAHEASLSSGTIAALAGGIDVVYPPQDEALMNQIGETGLLVSEMPPGLKPSARHFPRRNRLISGMSLGVVIIEAARRSGSLITARMALEQGREVFAVPGSPLDPRAEGANRLIRDGATLTRSADDVIEVLEPMLGNIAAGPDDAADGLADFAEGANQPAPHPPDEDARASITALLSVSPTSIDDIIRQSGSDAATVTGVLLELELAGRLVRQSGQLVALAPQDEAMRSL